MTSTDLPDEGGVREAIARIVNPEVFENPPFYRDWRWRALQDALAKADAILALFPVEGWVLVPVEPTEAMKEAAFGPIRDGGRHGPITSDFLRQQSALSVYRMMIKAAPPLQGGGGEAAWLVESRGQSMPVRTQGDREDGVMPRDVYEWVDPFAALTPPTGPTAA